MFLHQHIDFKLKTGRDDLIAQSFYIKQNHWFAYRYKIYPPTAVCIQAATSIEHVCKLALTQLQTLVITRSHVASIKQNMNLLYSKKVT